MNPNYAALSASDGAGEPSRATVQSPGRSIGSTAIPVDTTTNWSAGTFIATTGTLLSSGKLDPTTVQVFYGTASGTTVTITSFAAGYTDKGNTAGDVVVIKPTTEWANVASEGVQALSQFPNNFQNFVEPSGGVWTVSSGLVGTATAGHVWYAGARSAMAAVVAHTFTASKDTYVDYNPSTTAWTYVAATNGAAEPAVTSGCVRVAKVITGSSTITSVYQKRYQSPIAPTSILSTMLNLANATAPETGVQSYTNTGNGGGTGYYINLGGLKICWGISNSFSATSATNYTVSLPASFFSTLQLALEFLSTPSNSTLGHAANSVTPSTSTLTMFISGTAGITTSIGWLVIGT